MTPEKNWIRKSKWLLKKLCHSLQRESNRDISFYW